MSKREREKSARRREAHKGEPAQASLNNFKMSARKIRQVADNLTGLSVAEAMSALAFSLKGPARPLRKLIASAVANAERKGGADLDALKVLRVEVNMGTPMRRFMPRAQGRATRIKKPTSHVTVWLGE
ncbi:MAG: 50S ribosomal protein L22 [Deltaproteobacteria bacterium]|nr:50S ribosomal protein L22 [Deltaproteobacteria bacterium]